MAGTTGLEPATSDVTGRRSNQLSYVPAILSELFNSITTPGIVATCKGGFVTEGAQQAASGLVVRSFYRWHSDTLAARRCSSPPWPWPELRSLSRLTCFDRGKPGFIRTASPPCWRRGEERCSPWPTPGMRTTATCRDGSPSGYAAVGTGAERGRHRELCGKCRRVVWGMRHSCSIQRQGGSGVSMLMGRLGSASTRHRRSRLRDQRRYRSMRFTVTMTGSRGPCRWT